jgi:hypothetical protein
MTENEWDTTTDVPAMLNWVAAGSFSSADGMDRKLRLFVVTCCRLTPPQGNDGNKRRFQTSVDQLEVAADVCPYASSQLIDTYFNPDWDSWTLARWAARNVPNVAGILRDLVVYTPLPAPPPHILRDRDGLLVRLATAAYHSRASRACEECWDGVALSKTRTKPDRQKCGRCKGTGTIPESHLCPDAVAVLADACDEAGLGEAAGHFRAAPCGACKGRGWWDDETDATWDCRECEGKGRVVSRHYRGCWAIDCLLGKE